MRLTRSLSITALLVALALAAPAAASAGTAQIASDRYTVLLAGEMTSDGFDASATPAAARQAVTAAGGIVLRDLTRQIGVLVVSSPSPAFAGALTATGLFEDVGRDFKWQGLPASVPGGGPEQTADPLEPMQWDMLQIRTPQAHDVQAGARSVDVGILDSGIDGHHNDFSDTGLPGGPSNVDCSRGRNSITFVPTGPGVGTPDPCIDNQFHGTHVAGTVGMQANNVGAVGVAPNVTLVPVKVCDATGYCYASPVVDGITYAGDQRFDVINMSFFVDDNEFQESTEFKCASDPVQRTFRHAVERAIQYARNRGVTPVAALGNSDEDLAHPSANTNECEVVPAETQGVIGVSSLGRFSEKAGYSNYGTGANDVSAPGGNGTTGDCDETVFSTIPDNGYICIQGTSMASPHAAGVAALIVSQFGRLGTDGDVDMRPTTVEAYLQSSAIDIGERGYDECFGHGRIDALRAVQHDTSRAYDATAPSCPEYSE